MLKIWGISLNPGILYVPGPLVKIPPLPYNTVSFVPHQISDRCAVQSSPVLPTQPSPNLLK
jgi:hypothetical protein